MKLSIKNFNIKVKNDDRVENLIVGIRRWDNGLPKN